MASSSSLGKGLRRGGGIFFVLAVALLGLWLTARLTDRHGAIFLLGGGVFFALIGATLWTIGYSLTMAQRQEH